jgi:hypothetical protein
MSVSLLLLSGNAYCLQGSTRPSNISNKPGGCFINSVDRYQTRRQMATVTLFPPTQEPMEFKEATELTLNQGTLMFHARKSQEDSNVVSFVTTLPFLWVD